MSNFKDHKHKTEASMADAAAYADTKGDVMLELLITRPEPNSCLFTLKKRESPIYTHSDGKEVDIAEISGITVPEIDEIARIKATEYNPMLENRLMHSYGKEFMVEHDPLVEALTELFSRVRDYERRRVSYAEANDGNGIDRDAQVSITRMDRLRKFNVPMLRETPAVYHTMDKKTSRINLPTMSSGCVILLPRTKYVM